MLERLPPDWPEQMTTLNAVSLHIDHKALTAQDAIEIKKANFNLFCYTINDKQRAEEVIAWGVDAFCTDELEVFSDF